MITSIININKKNKYDELLRFKKYIFNYDEINSIYVTQQFRRLKL